MSVELSSLEKTLVVPLWHRAQANKAHPELLNDVKAIEPVNHLDYDFSIFEQRFTVEDSFRSAARARQFDDKLRACISTHPDASIMNLGAGLDTAFYRVDNGSIEWYDLDLPKVIALRKQLLPETGRVKYIAKSLFDTSWCADMEHTNNGIFILAKVSCGSLKRQRSGAFSHHSLMRCREQSLSLRAALSLGRRLLMTL